MAYLSADTQGHRKRMRINFAQAGHGYLTDATAVPSAAAAVSLPDLRVWPGVTKRRWLSALATLTVDKLQPYATSVLLVFAKPSYCGQKELERARLPKKSVPESVVWQRMDRTVNDDWKACQARLQSHLTTQLCSAHNRHCPVSNHKVREMLCETRKRCATVVCTSDVVSLRLHDKRPGGADIRLIVYKKYRVHFANL